MPKPETHIRRLQKQLSEMEDDGIRLEIVDGNICVVDSEKLEKVNEADLMWTVDESEYILKRLTNW